MNGTRTLLVGFTGQNITLEGDANFKPGNFQVLWQKNNTDASNWVLYNISFGIPEGSVPAVFPVSGIDVKPNSITLDNRNQGNPGGPAATLPYTLFIRVGNRVLAFDTAEAPTAGASGKFAEEPLQLENEPD